MSALPHGRIEATATSTGRLVYTGNAEEHPLPGWGTPKVFVPAQRRGDDGIGDLSDLVHIPPLGAFVRELLGAQTAKDGELP